MTQGRRDPLHLPTSVLWFNTMNHPSRLISVFASMCLVAFVLVTSGFVCDSVKVGETMVGMSMGANYTTRSTSIDWQPSGAHGNLHGDAGACESGEVELVV